MALRKSSDPYEGQSRFGSATTLMTLVLASYFAALIGIVWLEFFK